MGTITAIERSPSASSPFAPPTVAVQFPPRPGSPETVHTVVYEGRPKLLELQLAWATTVHKVRVAG